MLRSFMVAVVCAFIFRIWFQFQRINFSDTTVKMPRIYRKVNIEDVQSDVGEFIVGISDKAIAKNGHFSIGFSGGSSADIVSKGLLANSDKIDWSNWHVYFCDERHVKNSDPDSNFKGIHDKLLQHVKIPKENIHAMNDNLTVEESAKDYENQLKSFRQTDSGFPIFDCLILGMGPDGHICSLFPDHLLLKEQSRWVAAITDSPKPPSNRITLTLPVVNNSEYVVFISTGSSKAATVKEVLENSNSTLPAAMVKPINGEVYWYIDNAAGSTLTTR